jgi:hypothetical protein
MKVALHRASSWGDASLIIHPHWEPVLHFPFDFLSAESIVTGLNLSL